VLQNAQNVGFALPMEYLISELDMLKQDGVSKQYTVRCPPAVEPLPGSRILRQLRGELDVRHLFQTRTLTPIEAFVESIFEAQHPACAGSQRHARVLGVSLGHALIRIFVYKQNFLFATSPLVKLPRKNLLELYTYLLSNPVPPYVLGISGDLVYLSYRCHLSDLSHPLTRIALAMN